MFDHQACLQNNRSSHTGVTGTHGYGPTFDHHIPSEKKKKKRATVEPAKLS